MDHVYHVHAAGNDVVLRGQDEVKSLYRMWAETNLSIFFIEHERDRAVADHFIASVSHFLSSRVSGKANQAGEVLVASSERHFSEDD